ncbi:cupin domain-containing protein [Crenobacter luteus]|uniref:Cupin 2 conserved barrel domain-containing protein n=1 Tax=Crenobacter luteus TaxID=1452487 RepID=A0A165F8K2_9NEIS|nr:cupin domain-containing protein [Crenobacter luteus]KZE32464.1 hypothetical protein AVW16_11740 [Crenobacter luteus]
MKVASRGRLAVALCLALGGPVAAWAAGEGTPGYGGGMGGNMDEMRDAMHDGMPGRGPGPGGMQPMFVESGQLKWVDAPPSLPKGAKLAVLSGDPGKPGPFTIRLMAPAGYTIPPHWHTRTENVTVISGVLYLGMGDKVEQSKARALRVGGFHSIDARVHHYAFTRRPAVVQLHGEGPFDIHYLNPADDPQKGK